MDPWMILYKLICAALALLGAMLFTRWLDMRAGVKFADLKTLVTAAEWIDYAKYRWIGVCLVLAACFF